MNLSTPRFKIFRHDDITIIFKEDRSVITLTLISSNSVELTLNAFEIKELRGFIGDIIAKKFGRKGHLEFDFDSKNEGEDWPLFVVDSDTLGEPYREGILFSFQSRTILLCMFLELSDLKGLCNWLDDTDIITLIKATQNTL